MTDPLDDLAFAREPSHRLNYAPPTPKPDKTIYIALIAGGCLITIVMMWFVFAAPAPVTVAPAPAVLNAPAAPQPRVPAANILGGVETSAAPKQTPKAAAMCPAAKAPQVVWKVETAAELIPSILDDGRLQIIVKNKSPGKLVDLKIDIRTSVEENAVQTVQIPLIEPGKEFKQAYSFPELSRRTEPKAMPPMEISEGDLQP